MESLHGVVLHLMILMSFAIYYLVQAQDQQGFISLDCGLQADEPPYTEPLTKLTYKSDADFIKTGESGRIQYVPGKKYIKAYTVLRYFPDGVRNCYTLEVIQGTNYLIVAMFNYGNYDGLNIYPKFDLYLGPNIWTTVDIIQKKVNGTRVEIIHTPKSASLQVCLVKTGETTPFISALELRPLKNGTYVSPSGSLKNLFRVYFTDSYDNLRYPNDVHDRCWSPLLLSEWTLITTSLSINTRDDYDIPKDVVISAATPTNVSSPWTISWVVGIPNDQVYVFLHIVEIQLLGKNETREFDIVANANISYGIYSPKRLQIQTLFNTSPANCKGGICQLQLIRTRNSTLPPLVNAMEAFTTIEFPQSETNVNDVIAIKRIESIYGSSRMNWQGDPCVPKEFLWDGLTCKYTNMSTPPRIISLDLSSSGLTGVIVSEIQNLTQLQKLDLSNNNLTGGIPEFIANMRFLLVVNLSGNNFHGSLPQALLDKEKQGLELNIQGNPKLCTSSSCKTEKRRFFVPVVVSTASLAVVVATVLLFLVCKRKILSSCKGTPAKSSIAMKRVRFTYSEVLAMTNKLERVLGQGGFGMVYHGYINGTEEVAVKVLSPSSIQGYKEFKAEVELLLRVHHTNLVSLVGYCDKHDQLALVYEYMNNGDLKKHLSGDFVMSWENRLKIAVDAAQGLEYLHIGCKLPIVHRDVKSSNILLDNQTQAKLADFGLSRSFPVGSETYVSTVVAGTPGYLDPEYFQTNRLSERNDVYSFGIVLLEMITNQRVIDQTREKHHIAEWVKFMLPRGDIIYIMDPKLQGMHDVGSAWKAIEIAMTCVNPSSVERPDMSHVVHELKDCLISEKKRVGNIGITRRSMDVNLNVSSDVAPKAC